MKYNATLYWTIGTGLRISTVYGNTKEEVTNQVNMMLDKARGTCVIVEKVKYNF